MAGRKVELRGYVLLVTFGITPRGNYTVLLKTGVLRIKQSERRGFEPRSIQVKQSSRKREKYEVQNLASPGFSCLKISVKF